MKLKLELGSELDINAAFDGGAVDTSVTYSVPAEQQDTISVTSAGVVEALAVGTAIVQVKDTSGNLLRSIVVQVLSAADFAVQADLDSGAKDLTVDFE
jgi:methionine aminopeptidase